MTHARNTRLAEVKLALAAKYDRLALQARSRPKRRQFLQRAERYRRQARETQGALQPAPPSGGTFG